MSWFLTFSHQIASQPAHFLGILAFIAPAVSAEPMPLSEIQPGDRGEWRTVVRGTEVESFPLEVVGVIDSFAGPDIPIILCRATDALNTHSGPVSGMSGSPVYIDGRLIGAYAYGFPWSRDKTLIGVTPIESMLPLLEHKDRSRRDSQRPQHETSSMNLGLREDDFSRLPTGANQAGLSPRHLPLPLLAGGLDADILKHIDPWLSERGLRVTTGAGTGNTARQFSFEAGSPLAVILASGDLFLGGVGTVTHREGDRLLAFGHPMLGTGSVELPIGGAEIVDVVSSYRISFKLSNAGPPQGTLWQDSTPGIQAELGRVPYMIPIEVHSAAGDDRTIQGKLAEDRLLTPALALTYMAQTLLSGAEGPKNATIHGKLDLAIEGEEENLTVRHRGTGFVGGVNTLFRFAGVLEQLLNGSETFPQLNGIEADFSIEYGEREEHLHSVRLQTARIQPGSEVPVEITTRKADGSLAYHRVSIPLPPDQSESYSLLVMDASAYESYEAILSHSPSRSFESLLNELKQLRENGAIYIRLAHPVPGIRLEGENLENLPPSVLALYQSTLEKPNETVLTESIVWETEIPVEGVFSGDARINFSTEP